VTGLGEVALVAARAGAEAIGATLATGHLDTGSKSGAHDLVTAADRAAEAAIIAVLHRLRPEDAILGEETGQHAGSSDVRWLVDPLDGTVNFVYGRAGWAVSVGAEIAGHPVAGAVICPGDGRWAVADGSALQFGGFDAGDGRLTIPRPPISVGEHEAGLGDALISLGYPYGLVEREQVMAAARNLVGRVRALRLTGAAASELLGVAGGDGDAFVSFGLGPWDTSAGVALVLACGGTLRQACTAAGMDVVIAARSAALADDLVSWVVEPLDRLPAV
jgi:myo-inositol-1(or 4)-monophosphatase